MNIFSLKLTKEGKETKQNLSQTPKQQEQAFQHTSYQRGGSLEMATRFVLAKTPGCNISSVVSLRIQVFIVLLPFLRKVLPYSVF
jgi:hypothetical protein